MKYPRWIEMKEGETGTYTLTVLPEMKKALKFWWERANKAHLKEGEEAKPFKWFVMSLGDEEFVFKGLNENKKLVKYRLDDKPSTIEFYATPKRFKSSEMVDVLVNTDITSNFFAPCYGADDYIVTLRYNLTVKK